MGYLKTEKIIGRFLYFLAVVVFFLIVLQWLSKIDEKRDFAIGELKNVNQMYTQQGKRND